MRSDSVVGLILAAGYSRRFGEQDKRMVRFNDSQTLLAATLRRVTECFTHWRMVVREEDDLAVLGLPPDTPVIRTRRASLGQAVSMADGFSAIIDAPDLLGCRAAAVMLGDMPYIQAVTISALCARTDSTSILRVTYAGQPGHPVCFGRVFWPELVNLTENRGGASVIRRHPLHYREIPTMDSGVCEDIDRRSDMTANVVPRKQ